MHARASERKREKEILIWKIYLLERDREKEREREREREGEREKLSRFQLRTASHV